MPTIGPPQPDSQPENDFSDFMPTKSQIDAAIAMYHGDYKVPQIRKHFEDIGCTPIVVDGITTRVLDLALASLVRTQANEVNVMERLSVLGLRPDQIQRLLASILEGQEKNRRHHAEQSDARGLLAGILAGAGAMTAGLFGMFFSHASHSARHASHLEKMSNHSRRKKRRRYS